jgi:hypothetical protein
MNGETSYLRNYRLFSAGYWKGPFLTQRRLAKVDPLNFKILVRLRALVLE